MSSLRNFFISFSHFFTSGVLNLLFGFITFPILTRVLTREEYGVVGLVTTTMFLYVSIAKGGMSDGIIRYYERYSDTRERRIEFASTVAVRGLILSLATVIFYFVTVPKMIEIFHINRQYLVCFLIMGGSLFLSPLNYIVYNLFRVSGKTIFFNASVLFGKANSFGMSLLFFIYLVKGFYGYFMGILLSEIMISFLLFYWFFSNYTVVLSKVSGSLAMELIKFGIPFLMTEFSYLLLSYADRYMLAGFKGEAVVGLYSVGYNIASYISNLLIFSLSYAVIPIYVKLYEREGREKTEEFLRKCMHYMLIFIFPVSIGFFAVSKDLFITLASEKYAEAGSFSPIILIGSFLLGLNNILNAGLYLNKKTNIIFMIMIAAVVTNVAMNYFLIPYSGVEGAAVATLLSCLLSTILTIFLSFKFLVVRIDMKNILYYLLLSGAMYFVIVQIKTTAAWSDLILRILAGIFIILPCALFKEKEIQLKVKAFLFSSSFKNIS